MGYLIFLWFRSLEKYAPWIRHVYIVTNGQIPYWLNLDYEKVSIVTHEDIFENHHDLPTFSSTAIESNIHRIPNLSKHFLYFNDDIFLNNPIYLEDFITQNFGYKIYLSWPLPNCNDECPWIYIHDGSCDEECNVELCLFDGHDCKKGTSNYNENEEFTENYESTSKKGTTATPKKIRDIPWSFESKANNSYKLTDVIKSNLSLVESVAKYNSIVLNREKNRRKRYMIGQEFERNGSKPDDNYNRDAYARSLIYVNNLYNLKYLFEQRKAIAHMPIFLNKDILVELQNTFPEEYKFTIGNRFRSRTDMQFGFAYSYYLVNERKNVSIAEIFDHFDTDQSG